MGTGETSGPRAWGLSVLRSFRVAAVSAARGGDGPDPQDGELKDPASMPLRGRQQDSMAGV